jgi:hypothetical protein
MTNLFLSKFFKKGPMVQKNFLSFSVPHKQKSQGFKSGESRGHNPVLVTHLPGISFNSFVE